MKTFTSIQSYPEGTIGHSNNSRKIRVVWADTRREGLYRMTEFQTNTGSAANQFSVMYGKCNQSKILAATKNMIEVA